MHLPYSPFTFLCLRFEVLPLFSLIITLLYIFNFFLINFNLFIYLLLYASEYFIFYFNIFFILTFYFHSIAPPLFYSLLHNNDKDNAVYH